MDWEWREISEWAWVPGVAAILLGAWFEYRRGWKGTGETLRDLGVALSTAALISLAFFGATNEVEDERALTVERSDNRRFVLSLSGPEQRTRTFTGFDLRGQNLNIAELGGANFNEADLSEASLYAATLNGVDFNDAKLICSTLREAHLEWHKGLEHDALLRRAKLQGADLRGLTFGAADLHGAEFGSIDDIEDSDIELEYSKSTPTNLSGADLSHVQNLGPDNFLSPVIYDDDTDWPDGFPLPEKAEASGEYEWPSCTPSQYRLTEDDPFDPPDPR